MPKFGAGGAASQSLPPAETTPNQPASYAGGGAGSGWGGPTSYTPASPYAPSSPPYYARGRAQEGLAGTGGGGGGFGPEGFHTGYGSGQGGPGILVIAYPKTS